MQGMDYGMEEQHMMDGEYGDMGDMHDEYDQEGMDMGDGGMMDMGDHQYDDEEESINFDENPEFAHMPKLDKMRKIRRDILRTINELREAHGVPRMSIDP